MASQGVLFAATGAGYRGLARRAAESVKRHAPDLAVDLFTDEPVEAGVFDRVVTLDNPWFRSRIDAMARTRFERTLHLDADVLAVADVRDVFDVLDRFDVALAHDQLRNSPSATTFWRRPLPNAFPQFNGGVIAYRRAPPVLAFLREWAEVMRTSGLKRDQPALRELLWLSDLRIATLPEEYNLLDFREIASWSAGKAAPRILHHYDLHKHFTGRRREIADVSDLVGPMIAARLPLLIEADASLARLAGRAPRKPSRLDWVRAWLAGAAGAPRHFTRRVRHELLRAFGRR